MFLFISKPGQVATNILPCIPKPEQDTKKFSPVFISLSRKLENSPMYAQA